MSSGIEIFSLRIVIADFCLEKPDLCFIDGKEIKKVPLIRIFGSNAEGQKCCMHVHGVFPYFYIPYEKKEFKSFENAAHVIATSLDRAINLSLGRANSSTQHVFKVQLVKGIPFYGYHKRDHQFLKIYMLNPRFVRRAANLLHSGAIMGKIFQPYESHVPYILQFMIDYNLYGMSFLHVPREVVKFRRKNFEDEIAYPLVQPSEFLDPNVFPKLAISELEVDIGSAFILNRFQLINNTHTHSNPGIQTIWNDERIRRQNLMNDSNDIPALEIPFTQERPDLKLSESEYFNREALIKRLDVLCTISNESNKETTDTTQNSLDLSTKFSNECSREQKRTFNLQKLLGNAIYPEECTQKDNLINASFIENHLSAQSNFKISIARGNSSDITNSSTPKDDLDTTLIDEDLILSLTQPASQLNDSQLEENDIELLDVLQKLEEDSDNQVDLDSTLAQLSQQQNKCNKDLSSILPELDDKDKPADSVKTQSIVYTNDSESDQDFDDSNDFTICMDDIDDLLLKLTQNPEKTNENDETAEERATISQLDGDVKTPSKECSEQNQHQYSTKSRRRTICSALSPKCRMFPSKYEPLPVTCTSIEEDKFRIISDQDKVKTITKNLRFTSSSVSPKTLESDTISCVSEERTRSLRSARSFCSSSKKLTFEKISEETEASEFIDSAEILKKKLKPKRNQRQNLDKTHITCSLTPRKTNEKKLKVYNLREKLKRMETVVPEKKSTVRVEHQLELEKIEKSSKFNRNLKVILRRIPVENKKDIRKDELKSDIVISNESDVSIISLSPEAIPKKKRKCKVRIRKSSIKNNSHLSQEKSSSNSLSANDVLSQEESEKVNFDEEIFEENIVHSFYEKSFLIPSPPLLSDSSPTESSIERKKLSSPVDKKIIITPDHIPPTYYEVEENYQKYEILQNDFQNPFYSDPSDVTHKKEVNQTVLSVPGNSLNDCEEFKSLLGADLKGLKEKRKDIILSTQCGLEILKIYRTSSNIKEFFATKKRVLIVPHESPPVLRDVKIWIKARELLLSKNNILPEETNTTNEQDSPIKVPRRKLTMMINDGSNSETGSERDDVNCSLRSLTLTPVTPVAQEMSTMKSTIKKGRALFDSKKNSVENSLERASSEHSHIHFRDEDTISAESIQAKLQRRSFVDLLQKSSFEGHAFGGTSYNSSLGFKVDLENLQQARADIEHNYLTTLIVEVFVETRHELFPDPNFDAIKCIFYAIQNDTNKEIAGKTNVCGFIIVDEDTVQQFNGKKYGIDSNIEVKVASSELDCFLGLLDLCNVWDPDIYAGYEIEMSSWGYIMERGKILQLDIVQLLSRVPTQKPRNFTDNDQDEQLNEFDVEMKLSGRILLDVWRLMRSEIALTSYTFENVLYHILHRRCPRHQYRDLTNWFILPQTRWIVLEYYLERVKGTMAMLEQLDFIGRTCEMAKLIGIQFYEVLSRGSQFRVESMMLRIAKPKNLIPLSPSVQQRAHMRAPEYLPLIMEPISRFYPDPIIVLDFQSLYPSVIIAYNYCFSTCLGRVEHLGKSSPFEFGASQLRVSPDLVKRLLDQNLISISPCGVVFVKACVREGILPRMLTEILDTRQMVKQSIKLHKSNKALQRVLHSRQLGLKLMANVTYGYTAANFSGRMPSVEVGDSVVSKGRETLERAIKLIEATSKWNAKVVYGDTDSMFVLVRGRSRSEAFQIGNEIAEAVTQDNPQPVKLKFEKVYHPCILQTKKRYVGYMYESLDQETPIYEAKGIETVRRDGCPIVQKMLEKCLRTLFETSDVSNVKKYVCHQFTKLLSGRANIQDLIFAKEFRGLNGYKPTACVPALEMTRKWMQSDPRKIPRRGERVPFVIINGPPGVPLIQLVRSPDDVLSNESLKINAIYYITKAIIPPINRCFLLIGVDINEWFINLPRKFLNMATILPNHESISKKSTISQYFSTTKCVIDCGRQTKNGICLECCTDASKCVVTLQNKMAKVDRAYNQINQICQSCSGRQGDIKCASLDCPVLYVLETKRRDLYQASYFQSLLEIF